MLPEKQKHRGPQVSAHSPTTRQDMSQGSGNQHCHIHPFTLPSYQDDSKEKKEKKKYLQLFCSFLIDSAAHAESITAVFLQLGEKP